MADWNDREEEYLKKLHFQTNQMYQFFNKKHLGYIQTSKKFNIPIMVLSAFNSLIALTLPSFIEQEYVSILNSIISAGTGILGSILLYLKLSEKMNLSLTLSIKLNMLSLKISKELSLARERRNQSGIAFLNDCFNEYIAIIDKSLPIDRKLKNFLTIDDLINVNDTPSSSNPSSPKKIDHALSLSSLLTPENEGDYC
jgi:hypothetical protein